MRYAIARSVGTGVLALAVWGLARLTYALLLCPQHHAWVRAQAGGSSAIVDRGERIARPGDAILVCETWHRIGPIAVHRDLDCYCAPQTLTADTAGALVAGSCFVDKPNPTFSDDWGLCRYGRCNEQVGR
jgi:hypothetical protein